MEFTKRQTTMSLPELALIGGTRAIAGAGIGLLLAGLLTPEQRKAVGWSLLSVGALSTIPLGFEVLSSKRLQKSETPGLDRFRGDGLKNDFQQSGAEPH